MSFTAAAPASPAVAKLVTISLSDTGKGTWSISSDAEKGSLAMTYHWTGTFHFKIPAQALKAPGRVKYSVETTGTLVGSWTGTYEGTLYSGQPSGPYHCSYKATSSKAKVTAQLVSSATSGSLQLVLISKNNFFPNDGLGATTSCVNAHGADGPPHFEPAWLFRDGLSDHYRMSSDGAFLTFPKTLLSRGSAAVAFPKEIGSVTSTMRANLEWHNVGRLTARAPHA
jgi:hypothetical protein